MANVLVCGGGICGLGTALMLARDGHDVTVLERDSAEVPDVLGDVVDWNRPGVTQFRQSHFMHLRFRHTLDAELPDVRDAIIAAGGLRYDMLKKFTPPTLSDRDPRPGDDRYVTLTARRQVLEAVFARAAANEPRVNVVRGQKIAGLVGGPEVIAGVPHVIGVMTADGETHTADYVIDAMGRASKVGEWLQDLGGRPPVEEAEDCGFTYYGQYFHGTMPEPAGPLLAEIGTISVLTLPADNDTWTVVVWIASGDMPLKELRHWDTWTRVVRSVPLQAHWLEGERIGDLEAMSGIMDRYRRFVVDGQPVATGLFPVADAVACTNPSLGRGISLGMWHASMLREFMRGANGDPGAMAKEWDEITEANLVPWYRTQVNMDRNRVAQMDALRQGAEPPPPDPITKGFFTALQYDPDIYRAFLEVMGCLATPEELMGRPDMFEKMLAVGDKEPFAPPGPNREQLLEIVS